MINVMQLVKCFSLFREAKQAPTVEQLLEEWSQNPEDHFAGHMQAPLVWNTVHGVAAPMAGYSDSHGCSYLPDINCFYSKGQYRLKIGWIERVSMYEGGLVRINHFAISINLTRAGVGKTFLDAIVRFFKKMNAVSIEFHEDHSSRIAHYRRFFEKHGVKEIETGVWRIELYEQDSIPNSVLEFQRNLMH